MKTVDAARGKWPGIYAHFGVDPRYLNPKRHSDCPLCGDGKDRFRFSDHNGSGSFFCNQCHPNGGSGFDFLMQWTGKSFKELAAEIDSVIGNIEEVVRAPKSNPVKRLKLLESGVVSMDGINPVRKYLKRRGLHHTKTMQFNPSVGYWENGQRVGAFPAMLCKLVSPEGAALTYHITYLTPQGEKAPVGSSRKMATPVSSLDGSAIRLFPVTEHIGVAEGIETALAVRQLFGIPCWACANANLLEKFEPPAGVKSVSIFADNDANFTGQKAAYVLANRLQRKMPVKVEIPETIGADFADNLMRIEEQA